MVLVRKREKLTRDPSALQGRKRADSLFDRDSKVLRTVDHEHWVLPVRDVVDRVELFVVLLMIPRRSTVLPFAEPQLLSRIPHHPIVEDTVVNDEALPRLIPVPRDPVDHVSAIRRTERARAIRVEVRKLGERG